MQLLKKNRKFSRKMGDARYYNISTSKLMERTNTRQGSKSNYSFRISFFDNTGSLFKSDSTGKQFIYVGVEDTKLYFISCNDGEGWSINHPHRSSYGYCNVIFTIKKEFAPSIEPFANRHFELYHDEEKDLYFVDSTLGF